MRTLKNIMIFFILASFFIMCQGFGLPHSKSKNALNVFESPPEVPESVPFMEPVDCFDYAKLITGFSAEILRGIAATESHFRTNAVGDGGMSFGMFQLHSRWHESRVEKWGDFDPTDPYESVVIAGRIMQENLIAFNGDLRMAIAAYKQGILGVRKRGVIQYYVDDVLNWRNDPEKMLSFSLFCGITNTEVLQDEYKGAGTQDSYKFDDSVSVQVSWRGSSSISY
jgi:hypothetical protein